METSRAGRYWLTPEIISRLAIKKSKYNNIKTNGYDSKKEYHRAIVLNAMADNGQISHLRKQVPFVLQEAFKDEFGKHHRAIKYIADFVYEKNGDTIVEDVKSDVTAKKQTYRIKKKLFIARYPHLIFREVI